MKCRASAIIGISSLLRSAVDEDIIKDSQVVRKIEDYRKHDWNAVGKGKGKSWTTPEEIRLINETLDAAIFCIEKTYRI